MTTELISGLLLGVAGSMHCVGMCGPLVSALPMRSGSQLSRLFDRIVYHLSRTGMYALMGAVVGIGATVIDLAGYGQVISIVAGVGMVLTAVMQLLWHKQLVPSGVINRFTAPIRRVALDASKGRRRSANVLLGAVNALLPCGLVTSALIGSAAGGDVMSGIVFMSAFGIGTVPALVAISVGIGELRQRFGMRLGIVLPIATLIVGALVMLRGMELGIPLVSPANVSHTSHVTCCSGK